MFLIIMLIFIVIIFTQKITTRSLVCGDVSVVGLLH